MAFNDIGVVGYTPPGFAYNAGKFALNGLFGGGLFGGGGGGSGFDISGELARIQGLYDDARKQGTDAITQDFQAQRGELAQSQAARGILRSGVSQLGLAKLGAGRQQALAQFNSALSAAQAGQQSKLLDALMGRQTAIDQANQDRKRQGVSQLLGLGGGALGAYLGGPMGAAAGSSIGSNAGRGTWTELNGLNGGAGGGFNFFGGNYVSPQSVNSGLGTKQGFYTGEGFL